ncbi:hypothetical protein F909_03891 [Acinetobacter sp. ANC 3929]|uniref:hypothetical protein n=1 Tax=Acinetobacter sp. ANC 3929 TaxID=1217707 RepID=UPI0002CE52EA|nr:hypothetical protein [Acinetobacter sp. ANC 3929]ENW78205.1 hypothetical protein F909_03891 [Acinetobacter sp. ANC 3929]
MKKGRFDEIVEKRLNADDFAEPQEITQGEKIAAIVFFSVMGALIIYCAAISY